MEIRPQSEVDLAAMFRGLRFMSIAACAYIGVALFLLPSLAVSGGRSGWITPVLAGIAGGVGGVLVGSRVAARPVRPAPGMHWIRWDADGWVTKGLSRGSTVEVRFRWIEVSDIRIGRNRNALMARFALIRIIDSVALTVTERAGRQITFEKVGAYYSKADLDSFLAAAEQHLHRPAGAGSEGHDARLPTPATRPFEAHRDGKSLQF